MYLIPQPKEIVRQEGSLKASSCPFYSKNEKLDPEEYELIISNSGIEIIYSDDAGRFYAEKTLEQIRLQSEDELPFLHIKDKPSIACRGLSLDITRGRIPNLRELKRIADVLASFKMNQLQLYVEHSFAFEGEEEIWEHSTPITPQEIRELDKYCAEKHISLVPQLASFGHLYDYLRSPKYKHLCELETHEGYSLIDRMAHHTIDTSNPESLEFVTKRIREFSDCFSSKYFNICADETFDICKEKSKALGEEKGARRVYLDFLVKLCECVLSLGKTPMFWGDVLIEEPELIKEIPGNPVLLNWEYSPEVNDTNVTKLSKAGITNVFLCPGVHSWNHFINKYHDAYRNISGTCANAHKVGAKGLLVTEWGDLGGIAETGFSDIAVAYAAAFSWSDRVLSEAQINKALSLLLFGDKSGKIVDMLMKLSEKESVDWWRFVYSKELTDGSIDKRYTDFGPAGNVTRGRKYKTRLINQIEAVKASLDLEAQRKIDAYILSANMDTLAAKLGMYSDGKRNVKVSDAEMDELLAKYEEQWLKTSKPSEFFRVKDIFNYYRPR